VTASAMRTLLIVGVALLAACSGPGAPPPQASTGIVVTVTPATAQVAPAGTRDFSALVTGTVDTSVTWSIEEGTAGGSVSTSGAYTAPDAAGTYHVVASSNADPSRQQVGTVTVSSAAPVPTPAAIVITITPATAALDACKGQVFSATVTGASDTLVSWAVAEAGGGTVTNGIYTAPPAEGTYHVVATSAADPTKSAQATVTIGPDRVAGVTMAPLGATLLPGGAQPFAATVTTGCGTFPATAP